MVRLRAKKDESSEASGHFSISDWPTAGQWRIMGQHIMPVFSWPLTPVDDGADIIMPIMSLPVIECIDWHICIMLLGVAAIGFRA
jgi:hypothetical protein